MIAVRASGGAATGRKPRIERHKKTPTQGGYLPGF
jgi:hypothetical protein